VVEALLSDARALLRSRDIEIRAEAPAAGEIGASVVAGEETRWLVARAQARARSTIAADEEALHALAAVASDAIARLALTEEMVHVARHDPLTDLPNRSILLARVTQALETARQRHTQAALLFLDLDGFKPVNDRFGHTAGDAVLVEIAGRLRACVREHDTVARLGGDEFAVLIEDIDPADMPDLCERIIGAVEASAHVAGQPVRVGASVGIAYDRGHDTAASLLRNADMAMYEAKARGKGRYVEYRPAMGHARLERLELVDDLRGAVDNGELEVVYQPVVSVSTRRIRGAEALARWCRNGVYVPPDVFISIAEETGLIVALGEAVLRQVSRDAAHIRAAGGSERTVSVNISAGQLREPGFIDTVARAVESMAGTPLILEITERQGVDLDGDVLAAMRAIGDMGVRFAIDDFGVGFSSISYLHDLPAQIIKADAALSQEIDRDARARGLLRSVVLMGSSLGFDVVVEGIERETQYEVLQQDAPQVAAQGYLMHRPMPLERLIEVLAAERSSVDG
jgi:diguanylate cyclase (GGDEF)-like protein